MTHSETHSPPLDINAIRARLAESRGKQLWRSLDELADTPSFRAFLHREFPQGAAELAGSVDRRTFLKIMGASFALAGLTGCGIRQPQEKIAPFAQAPAEYMPGMALQYASALGLGGFASGVLVESHEGRPTKIEGNPNHPASLGATDVFAQAEILTLYDPDRAQAVLNRGALSTWDAFIAALTPVLQIQQISNGSGLRVLTETVTSPTMASQLRELLQTYPEAKWYQFDPVGRGNVHEGARLAFGEIVTTRYNLERARVIVALDADFLAHGPGHLRYAREFANGRRVSGGQTEMNRLYVVESTPTITGISADHRLPLRASQVEAAARFLARQLGVSAAQAAEAPAQEWLAAVARDLQAHRGASLVLAGEGQPPIVHALAHAMNAALGNVGTTVEYTDPVEAAPVDSSAQLRELVAEIEAGQVEALFILAENPAYAAPADVDFAGAMARVKFSVELSLYNDETSALASWHIPATHPLEMWTDLRAYDGTATIGQPLILPLYNGHSPHELLALLLNQAGAAGYDIVRAYWESASPGDDFDTFWRGALHNGVVPGTRLPARAVTLRDGFASQPPAPPAQGLELVFQPDPTIYDGRYANNGWLQELPKPITKLTWDNAALVSPATAQALGLQNEEVVELRYGGRAVRAPVWIVPGQASDTVTVYLGYGRNRAGNVGSGQGFNAYALRTADAPWFGGGLEVVKTGQRYALASTQEHWSMEGRDLVRVGVLEEYLKDPKYIAKEIYAEKYGTTEPPGYQSILPDFAYTENAWGMTIDLNTCIGCNACTIACQAENNIPIVGKDEVIGGREMHWIRIDGYFSGDNLDNPATYVQPVTCMQCEQAPCELVCPVNATVHDHEGINQMVYNRCVGTKYCSNNCPYKVRRFNFYQYNDLNVISLALGRNPDVTVRNRGVMEKCTYCVQRISAARIEAKKIATQSGQPPSIPEGAIVTACQQVCPTQAIVFGDTRNPDSQVAKLKAQPLNYTLLDELNTFPRTSYLARLRNPNPDLE